MIVLTPKTKAMLEAVRAECGSGMSQRCAGAAYKSWGSAGLSAACQGMNAELK